VTGGIAMKRITVKFFIVLLTTFLLFGCATESERLIPKDIAAAKFEYAAEEDHGYKLITGELETLTRFFNSLRLEKTDLDFSGDWIYRITFTNIVQGTKEKIVIPEEAYTFIILVGESCLQIDGETLVVPEGVDYSDVLDSITGKYNYFDYDLLYP